jgi:hypothetical protein
VIGRFSDRLRRAFEDPVIGVVVSYDRMSNSAARDWFEWRIPRHSIGARGSELSLERMSSSARSVRTPGCG